MKRMTTWALIALFTVPSAYAQQTVENVEIELEEVEKKLGKLLEDDAAKKNGDVRARDDLNVIIRAGDDEEIITRVQSGAWLGVQVADVPAGLAFHLRLGQGEGVMIRNVVKGSPADKVGLVQFDVVNRLDGEPIKGGANGFMAALRGRDEGSTVSLGVVHKGETREVGVQFSKRTQKWEYKFKDLEQLTDRFTVRGGRLLQGPDGWSFEYVPEVIAPRLEELNRLHKDGFGEHFFFNESKSKSADGKALELEHSEENGKFRARVRRKDQDGTETDKTYDSPEDLKKDDPEAFKLLESGKKGKITRKRHDLDKSLRLYLQEKLDAKEIDEILGDKVVRSFSFPNEAGTAKKSVAKKEAKREFQVAEDGTVTVKIEKNGSSLQQTFKSLDEMKEKRPQLFKHYEKLLE